MASLLRWDPVKEFDDLARRLNPMYRSQELRSEGRERKTVEWAPSVDIAEEEGAYIVKAELPEVQKEAVKVVIENGVLTLSGERTRKVEKTGIRFHRVEREYGAFLRSFTLPDDADPKKISANMKDGVLTIRIEKLAEAKPLAVEINVD
ncbi:MAG: Hsp20/alpha crystallin family protein [Nitrospirota bacterium]|nr:Hsp20/alpha crystallin family protein [Nitrospirota bacterium]